MVTYENKPTVSVSEILESFKFWHDQYVAYTRLELDEGEGFVFEEENDSWSPYLGFMRALESAPLPRPNFEYIFVPLRNDTHRPMRGEIVLGRTEQGSIGPESIFLMKNVFVPDEQWATCNPRSHWERPSPSGNTSCFPTHWMSINWM